MGKSERLIGGNDHVCTPEEIWGPIVRTLTKDGKFALDPMTNPKSNVPAHVRITNWVPKDPKLKKLSNGMIVGNGLEVDWRYVKGPIWLNGPYSDLVSWLGKASRASHDDPNAELVAFPPVRTSGFAWQQYVFGTADAILFLHKRVQHDNEDFTAPFHQSLVYWGPRPGLFADATLGLGTLLFKDELGSYDLRDNRIHASFTDAEVD